MATFVPPGLDPADGSVTRRVVVIDDGAFLTRRDSAATVDPWVVPLSGVEVERAAFSVPWLGYPMIALEGGHAAPVGSGGTGHRPGGGAPDAATRLTPECREGRRLERQRAGAVRSHGCAAPHLTGRPMTPNRGKECPVGALCSPT